MLAACEVDHHGAAYHRGTFWDNYRMVCSKHPILVRVVTGGRPGIILGWSTSQAASTQSLVQVVPGCHGRTSRDNPGTAKYALNHASILRTSLLPGHPKYNLDTLRQSWTSLKLFNCGYLESLRSDCCNEPNGTLSESTNIEHSINSHVVRLDHVLSSWNFRRIPVSGDGNCLFYAVSLALLQKNKKKMLQRLGCSSQTDVKELARVLRQATVTEWLGENSQYYQSFLTHDQLREQAQRFLADGEYCGDLGDLVLPALVNALSLPITVFTSAENMPVLMLLLMLLPISSIPYDSHPLFIAYNQDGSRTLRCSVPY